MAGLSLSQAFLSILSGIVVALISGYIAQVRENQYWLKEEVYHSIYNELVDAAEGNFPEDNEGNYWSVWEDYDVYRKHKVDTSLRQDLDSYTERLRRLNGLELKINHQERLHDLLPKGMAKEEGSELELVYEREEKKRSGPLTVSTRKGISLTRWIEMFGEVVVESEDSEDMRKKLIEYSEANELGHEDNFRRWDEKYADWHSKLWDALHHDEQGLDGEIEEIENLRNEVTESATQLKNQIKKRTNQSFLRALFNRWV